MEYFYVAAASVWGRASLLLLASLLFCHLWVETLRRGSVPVRDGDAAAVLQALCGSMRVRAPLLLASARVRSPFLTGLWRPAILLPAAYESEFDGPALRALLIHELTHLARWGCAWHLLARCACAALWAQPLLLLLSLPLRQAGH